jgi:hypothetical protein
LTLEIIIFCILKKNASDAFKWKWGFELKVFLIACEKYSHQTKKNGLCIQWIDNNGLFNRLITDG